MLLNLGRIARASAGGPDALLDVAIDELAGGLEEIRELASGLHPSVLTERGLAAALEALALRRRVPVELRGAARPPAARAGRGGRVLRRRRGARQRAQARRRKPRRRARRRSTAEPLVVGVVDDGVGGADEEGTRAARPRGPGRGAGGTAPVESPAGGGPGCSPRSRLRRHGSPEPLRAAG